MRSNELDKTVALWRAANLARGRPDDGMRLARVREELLEASATTYVAVSPHVVGMVLLEPGRIDNGAGPIDPDLLHISMLFVDPSEQRTGVATALLRHVFGRAVAQGFSRVTLWTAKDNEPAQRLYESVGMTPARPDQPGPISEHLQYECRL